MSEEHTPIRLHRLEGFYWVGKCEGFASAASAMPYPITGPALHQQVRKLERTLGIQLLKKGPKRRMLLTPEARELHRFVAPFFENLPGLVRSIVAGRSGELRVGTEPLYVEGLSAPALAKFQEEHPDLRMRLVERDATDMIGELEQGKLDVAIAGGPLQTSKNLFFEPLGNLGLALLVPADHPLAAETPPLSPTRLSEESFITYEPKTEGRRFTETVLEKAGMSLRVAAETSSTAAMRSLVRAGVGPAFLPVHGEGHSPARNENPDGSVRFDVTHLLERIADLPPFGLLYRKDAALSPLVTRFREIAAEVASGG